ncbi:MAG: 1-deoxy-D-xylulose-5-phosphate synthase [Hyphomicrobiaceae bacterium hypho_1]
MRGTRSTEDIAHGIRCRVFEHTIRNNGGYLSQACSAAEQLAWLYNEELRLGPPTLPMVPIQFAGVPSTENINYKSGAGYNGPVSPEFDRIFIAPAHYALVAYATLVELKRMAPEGLAMFNKDGSSVEQIGAEHSPGMEVHNGTLGIGLSTGSGLAWARKRRGEQGRVWVFMSDGETQEGQTWEAIQTCAHHNIDNLKVIMDVNQQQCDGAMDSVMKVGNVQRKMEEFGAKVVSVDGHDLREIRQAALTSHSGKPLIILANTCPYQGMPALKTRFPRLHYVRFKTEDERAKMNIDISSSLGIDPINYNSHAASKHVIRSSQRTFSHAIKNSNKADYTNLNSVEMVSRPYERAFTKYAVANPDVLCLSADLSSSCEVDKFRDNHPEQFITLGMAEQNMLSFAGGLGLAGFRPFVHSFGVFLYRRPYEQLLVSIAYSRRRVRLMGFLPGITTPGGMTHQAIEDISVMRSIPNMTILETGDATEVESICSAADSIDGPVYCRVLRGLVPRLFSTPIKVGEIRELALGTDILVITSGIMTEEALRARNVLERFGVSIRHLHLHTLKPFDTSAMLDHITSVNVGIVTLENHVVYGGIGSLVAEIIADYGLDKHLIRLGLQDTYAHGGSRSYLIKYYGFDAISLIRAIEKLLGESFGITEHDLEETRIEPLHLTAKAEGL